jgi:hypothetical protein
MGRAHVSTISANNIFVFGIHIIVLLPRKVQEVRPDRVLLLGILASNAK